MTHDQSGQSLRSDFLVLISCLSNLLHELRSVLDLNYHTSIVIQSLIIEFLLVFLPFSKACRIYPSLVLGHWQLIFGCSMVCCGPRWTYHGGMKKGNWNL